MSSNRTCPPSIGTTTGARERSAAPALRHGSVAAPNSMPCSDPERQRSSLSTGAHPDSRTRSEEHTSELQSLIRISYAVFCLQKKKPNTINTKQNTTHQN